MSWTLALFALFALLAALIAVGLTISQGRKLTALIATVRSMTLQWDQMQPLTSSSLAALAEMQDSLKRGEELLLKVNRREIANAKNRASDGTFNTGATLKDQLRAQAGLRAGQVPRHQ